ncbi:MAG: hypothetical protein H6578_04170 [Chitinophagales bacterium]|nr:hypothetical protein [Chitinophagales bacterium]
MKNLLFISIISILICACNKKESICTNDDFCTFINTQNFEDSRSVVNHFLAGIDDKLPKQEKINLLIEWLNCKNCILNTELICVSCIRTNPPQSELNITIIENGTEKEYTMDIIMGSPLVLSRYHEPQ